MEMMREFEIEAGKFVAVSSPEYLEMIEDYLDNLIDNHDDIEPEDLYSNSHNSHTVRLLGGV